MLCIEIKNYPDGFCVIRVTDSEGPCFSLSGFGNIPALRLLESHNVDVRG